jgi:hypothetical protein
MLNNRDFLKIIGSIVLFGIVYGVVFMIVNSPNNYQTLRFEVINSFGEIQRKEHLLEIESTQRHEYINYGIVRGSFQGKSITVVDSYLDRNLPLHVFLVKDREKMLLIGIKEFVGLKSGDVIKVQVKGDIQ